MIRWWGLAINVLVIGLIAAWPYLEMNSMIEEVMEEQLSAANGARVEIEGLDFSFDTFETKWDAIQITDPADTWTNRFQTGPSSFTFKFWNFWFFDTYQIENLSAEQVIRGAKRSTDGYMEFAEEVVDSTESSMFSDLTSELQAKVSSSTLGNFDQLKKGINAKELLEQMELQTPTKVDSTITLVEARASYWNKELSNPEVTQTISRVTTTAKNLNINDLKDIKKIPATVESIKSLGKDAKSVKKTVDSYKNDFNKDVDFIKKAPKDIKTWVAADYEKASQLAKLPELSVGSIGTTLFGEPFAEQLETYLGYYQQLRSLADELMSEETEEEVLEERLAGTDVKFSDTYDGPGFSLNQALFSGTAVNGMTWKAEVRDISSDPKKSGKPYSFQFNGTNDNQSLISVNAQMDRTSKVKSDEFSLAYSDIPLKGVRVSKSDLMPYPLKSGMADAELKITSSSSTSISVDVNASLIAFDFSSNPNPKDRLDRVIQQSLKSTRTITLSSRIEKKKVNINTNLDKVFANALKNTVKAEVDRARQQIRQEVDNRVKAKTKELEQLSSAKSRELVNKMSSRLKEVDTIQKLEDEKMKEVEKRKKEIEKEIEKKIKEGAIKNIIKF